MGRVISIDRRQIPVSLGTRRFVVQLNAEGKPVRIYERKEFGVVGGTYGVRNQTYWTVTQHRIPKKGICFRILKAAGCVPTEP